jgi:hypothetical protein
METTMTNDDGLDREIKMMEAEGYVSERWQRGLAWLRELRDRRAAAPAIDPALCRRLAMECSEDDARMSPAPWTVEADVVHSDGDGIAEFTGEAMIEDDIAVARVRNNLAAIAAQLLAAAGLAAAPLDGIDQGAPEPADEISLPVLPMRIGADDTLDLDPTGEGR